MSPEPNHIAIEIGKVENICFVVMPLDSLFQIEYERVIRPAVESLGLICVRGDEIYSKPQIMADIWRSIRRCRLIIAELTGRNANVFYEIGLAHAIGKPIILLTRNEDDVPFDLKALRYRYYNTDDPFWGDNLSESIQTMIKSILNNPNSNSYLEGIISDVEVPSKPKIETKARQPDVRVENISGNWKVSFSNEFFEHEGVANITQKENTLSATMTLTFAWDGVISVIQEVLSGSINATQVTLIGVSYTYIHQGNVTKNYNLDTFELQLSADGQVMEGQFSSESDTGTVVFKKE